MRLHPAILLIFCLCLFVCSLNNAASSVILKEIRTEPANVNPNLIKNYSFEMVNGNGLPDGSQWSQGRTDATWKVDDTVSHSGKRSLKITNGTLFGPNVYGMLTFYTPIKLEVGKPYTLSAWVKSESPGQFGLITGNDWQYRVYAPAKCDVWSRISMTFTPKESDANCIIHINTESPTNAAWMDDLKLEAGSETTPVEPADEVDHPFHLNSVTPETDIQTEGAYSVPFVVFIRDGFKGKAIANLTTSRIPSKIEADLELKPGVWRISVHGSSALADDTPISLALTLRDSKYEVITSSSLHFYSAPGALKRITDLKQRLPGMKKHIEVLKAGGKDVSYPLVTYTVLENFTNYADEDARKGELKRSVEQINDMKQMAARLDKELADAISGKLKLYVVPRWTGTVRPVIKSSSFIAPTQTLTHKKTGTRPVFFYGYGHFNQVVDDMEKWPSYGTNMIQIEVGPSAIFPTEGKVDRTPINHLLKTLDRAKIAGVGVCLLISPHYMPDWAFKKWPQLSKHTEGFLAYCLHAPEGQKLIQDFLSVLIPPIKDHPALNSICLTNEPVHKEEPCEYASREWEVWLQKKHGDIEKLNTAWGTTFASLDAIPLPDPFKSQPAKPKWLDYIRYNQEFFAGWHRLMEDAIHAISPPLPVHAKAMNWTFLNQNAIYGVDATLFGGFSQINGNDAVNWYTYGNGEFAQEWLGNAMGHDLQRSVLDAPIFNTENHIITDRDTRYVPAEHIRAALWQAAAHGQSATAIWVWGRTFDPKSDFSGSIMHRPLCAEAVGVVNSDLNRAALEMTAIQQAPSQALILESVSARVWDGESYVDCMNKLYTALAFNGIKIGFTTERQLEIGIVPSAPVLFIPDVTHLSSTALSALRHFKGRVVFVGADNLLASDEYGKPLTERLTSEKLAYTYPSTTWQNLWKLLLVKLPEWKVQPAVQLRDARGLPLIGVEWRCAKMGNDTVVNICNYQKTPVTCELYRKDSRVAAKDILTGNKINAPFTLKPLEVRLVQITAKTTNN